MLSNSIQTLIRTSVEGVSRMSPRLSFAAIDLGVTQSETRGLMTFSLADDFVGTPARFFTLRTFIDDRCRDVHQLDIEQRCCNSRSLHDADKRDKTMAKKRTLHTLPINDDNHSSLNLTVKQQYMPLDLFHRRFELCARRDDCLDHSHSTVELTESVAR